MPLLATSTFGRPPSWWAAFFFAAPQHRRCDIFVDCQSQMFSSSVRSGIKRICRP